MLKEVFISQNEHRIKESRGDKSMKQAVATNVIAAYAISTKALGQFGTQAFANDSLWRVAA